MYALILQLFSHPEVAIVGLFQQYGVRIYSLMFIEYFLEVALVVASFLPRDGILFMIGALSLQVVGDDIPGKIDIDMVFQTIVIAGILGDIVSYYMGKYLGTKMINKQYTFLNQTYIPVQERHIEKVTTFISSYGYKAFLYGRLFPFFRNLMPFVVGMLGLDVKKFIFFDSIGIFTLVGSELLLGRYFGEIGWVKHNISWITIVLICALIFGPFIFAKLQKIFMTKNEEAPTPSSGHN